MDDQRQPRASVARTLARGVLRLLGLACALLVAAAVVVVVVLPRATNGSAMTVLTGSMTPAIPVGSIVVVRPVNPETLDVGDVATYQRDPGKDVFVTHRVAAIDTTTTPTSFSFQGDANRGADADPVVPDQVRGEVWFHVPYLGAIRDGLHGEGGLTLLVTLLLAGYAASQLAGGLRDRRRGPVSGPIEVPIDRVVIAATLDRQRLHERLSQTLAEAAAAWSALLVREDSSSGTLLIAPPPDTLAATLEFLEDLEPVEVLVLDRSSAMSGRPWSSTPAQEPDRVAS